MVSSSAWVPRAPSNVHDRCVLIGCSQVNTAIQDLPAPNIPATLKPRLRFSATRLSFTSLGLNAGRSPETQTPPLQCSESNPQRLLHSTSPSRGQWQFYQDGYLRRQTAKSTHADMGHPASPTSTPCQVQYTSPDITASPAKLRAAMNVMKKLAAKIKGDEDKESIRQESGARDCCGM